MVGGPPDRRVRLATDSGAEPGRLPSDAGAEWADMQALRGPVPRATPPMDAPVGQERRAAAVARW